MSISECDQGRLNHYLSWTLERGFIPTLTGHLTRYLLRSSLTLIFSRKDLSEKLSSFLSAVGIIFLSPHYLLGQWILNTISS